MVSIGISIRNSKKITEVHVSTNSKMDELLKVSREASRVQGIAEGRAQVHEEAAQRKETITDVQLKRALEHE